MRIQRQMVAVALAVSGWFTMSPAHAADPALAAGVEHGRFSALDGWWHTRWHEKLAARGIHPYWSYTAETMGNVRGGLRRGAVYDGYMEAGARLDLEKLAGWRGAQFSAAMNWTHGASLSQKLLGDLFAASNIDAYDSLRLYEIWLEQQFWNGRLTLKGGQMAADREFLISDLSSLFCNGTFGWPGVAGANIRAASFPLTTPGLKLSLASHEQLGFVVALFSGEPDPTDAAGNPLNKHGTHWRLSDPPLAIAELSFTPKADSPTTLKVGGWHHFGDYPDYRWDDTGLALADPASSGNPRVHRGNHGLYAMLDLSLWREPGDAAQGLAAFARVAYAPRDRNLLDVYWDAGLHYTGLLPGRSSDQTGLGIAYGRLARPVREAVRDQNTFGGGATPLPDHELVVELTHKAILKKWWTLQPGVQWIHHPGGSHAIPDALVIGLRSIMSF